MAKSNANNIRHEIAVRPNGRRFSLYNGEAICGPRLYHGEDPKKPGHIWPFKNNEWMHHKTSDAADAAKTALQTYLNNRP